MKWNFRYFGWPQHYSPRHTHNVLSLLLLFSWQLGTLNGMRTQMEMRKISCQNWIQFRFGNHNILQWLTLQMYGLTLTEIINIKYLHLHLHISDIIFNIFHVVLSAMTDEEKSTPRIFPVSCIRFSSTFDKIWLLNVDRKTKNSVCCVMCTMRTTECKIDWLVPVRCESRVSTKYCVIANILLVKHKDR